MKQFVLIDGFAFDINSELEIELARKALAESGRKEASVWFGDPNDPSAYKSTVHKLFPVVAS